MNGSQQEKQRLVVAMLALLLSTFVLLPTRALASDAASAIRLSEIVDDTLVLGKGDVDWSYAEPNLILEEGDLLQTNETGMAEMQLDGGLVFRTGENSRIIIVEADGKKVVGIDDGRAYFRITKEFTDDEGFILTFPAGQLSANGKTLTRIDVSEDGSAELNVIRGNIELETASETARLVQEGERVFINSNGQTDFTTLNLSRRDAFDSWNEERDIALSIYRRPAYVEEDIVGSEDLEDYGEWVYAEEYSTYAWRPHVVEVWRPYYYGRWYHSNYYGWTWIPQEPWGYVTHHYGSWNYTRFYGWIWLPGYVWRPAHVRWIGCGTYVGWVPLGYYGHPVITTYPYHVTNIHISYVDVHSFTFVHRDDIHHYHKQKQLDQKYKHLDQKYKHFDQKYKHLDQKHKDLDIKHKVLDLKDKFLNNKRKTVAHKSDNGIQRGGADQAQSNRRDIAVDINEIKDGKLRSIKNIENEKLGKSPRKGRISRQKFDYEKVLDVKNHPKMQKRVAKLNGRNEQVGKAENERTRTAEVRKHGEDLGNRQSEDRNTRLVKEGKRTTEASEKRIIVTKRTARRPDSNVAANDGNRPDTSATERAGKDRAVKERSKSRDVAISGRSTTTRGQTERGYTSRSTNKPSVKEKVRADSMKRAGSGREQATGHSVQSARNIRSQDRERTPQRPTRLNREISKVKRNESIKTESSARIQQGQRPTAKHSRVEKKAAAVPAKVERSGSPERYQQRIARPAQKQGIGRRETAGGQQEVRETRGRVSGNQRSMASNRINRTSGRAVRPSPRSVGRRR